MTVKEAAKKILRPVYYRLPASFCYGPQFGATLRLLDESEQWSRDQLADYQLNKLRALLAHADRHVPYYKKLFRRVGFDPTSVREVSDLSALPLLDRETVRANTAE